MGHICISIRAVWLFILITYSTFAGFLLFKRQEKNRITYRIQRHRRMAGNVNYVLCMAE